MINILQKRRLISAIRLHFVLRSSGFYIDRWKYKCLWSHHMFMVCNINLKCHYQLERNWWQEQHNHKQTRYLENARLSCSSSEWILTQTASTSLELEYLFFCFIFSAKELSDVDIIAIAVSLGLTAFLVVVVGYFMWRARNNPPINKNNNITGHVST